MHILIATPTYDGKIEWETHQSVLQLVSTIITRKLAHISIKTKTGLAIDRARNIFASMVLNEPSYTHLLFIDADMGFKPEAILRLLEFDKPVSAIVSPSKVLPLRFVAAENLERKDGRLVVHDGHFVRTKQIGTGLMLIKREALETIRDAYPDLFLRAGTPYSRAAGLKGPLLQAFAPLYTDRGNILSEDISFCRRWTDTGGELWASIGEEVVHVGRHAVRGTFTEDTPIFGDIAPEDAGEG